MDIKILNNLFLTIEWRNPLKRQGQTIHRIVVHPGLLKCGKVEMESKIDQGKLRKILGIQWGKLTRNEETIQERTGEDPLQRVSKERLILKSSSWEVTQQNWSIKSGTECELDRKECRTMQRIVLNI